MHSSRTDLARCECAFTHNLRAIYARFTRTSRALHARFTRASRALHARFARISRACSCASGVLNSAHILRTDSRASDKLSYARRQENHLLGPEASRCASCLSVEHQVSAASPLRPALSPVRDATSVSHGPACMMVATRRCP